MTTSRELKKKSKKPCPALSTVESLKTGTDHKVQFKEVVEAQRQIGIISDKARAQLEDALSCLTLASGNLRRDYYLDCAKEYMRCLNGLIRLAERTVPVSGNGGKKTETDTKPVVESN